MKRLCIIAIVLLYAMATASPLLHAQSEEQPSVMFTSLRVGSTSEMVELFNPYGDIDVTGWYIEYSNVSGSNVRRIGELHGILSSNSYMAFTSTSFDINYPQAGSNPLLYSGFADSGGFIRLYKPDENGSAFSISDEIGWQSALEPSASTSVISLPSTKTAHRCTDGSNAYVKRNNQQDYYLIDTPVLGTMGNICPDLVVTEEDDGTTNEDNVVNLCEGVLITEILPNPIGDDSGKEFVELYNSTALPVSLEGCAIMASNKTYAFTNTEIPPMGYLVLYDLETGLSLINSKQETVYFVGSNMTEIQQVTYPANMNDDQAWASNNTEFFATYIPTPGEQNRIEEFLPCLEGYERNPETSRCNKVITVVGAAQVCASGYELNTSTGRCRKISTTNSAACLTGQVRNPQTNRCKTITQQAKTLVACKVDEYRNPETNRCKKLDTGSDLSPCPVGQTRSQDTNRCRNEDEIDEPIKVQDIPARQVSTTGLPVSVISIGALSYAVYEWKPEIRRLLKKLLRRR